MLAQATSYTAPGTETIRDRTFHYTILGFYVQDDWRVRSGLTLNLGLRYEFNTQVNEVRGRGVALRDIQHDATTTLGPNYLNASLRNVSPRFGFAWDVTGDSKTAVRGGFGLLYDIGNQGAWLYQNTTGLPPFAVRGTVSRPATLVLPLTFPPEAAGKSLTLLDYHMQQPHMLSYNLTVERALPFDMALSLAYGGSRGINIPQLKEGNPTIPQVLPDGRQFWTGNEPRTNPNWSTMSLITAAGNSWYNSLQFGLSKRLTKGLQFQSSYTWSKLMDETQGLSGGDASFTGPPSPSDPSHRKVDRGLAVFDLTQNWRFNAIYRLPDLVAASHLGKVLHGWWMSGILSIHSGYPFNPDIVANRIRFAGPPRCGAQADGLG